MKFHEFSHAEYLKLLWIGSGGNDESWMKFGVQKFGRESIRRHVSVHLGQMKNYSDIMSRHSLCSVVFRSFVDTPTLTRGT